MQIYEKNLQLVIELTQKDLELLEKMYDNSDDTFLELIVEKKEKLIDPRVEELQ